MKYASSVASNDIVPIVPGFHPDPSICRVGETYYLVHSSMEYSPAVPVRRSSDLATWELIGNALTRDEQFAAGQAPASRGVWAPTIRHHDDTFYLITTDSRDDESGQLLFQAKNPAGPWSSPLAIPALRGIDPDLAWDEDGTCLVSYCSWNETKAGIRQAAINLDTGDLLERPRWIWEGSGLSNPEGPHLYRRGPWWYLVIAEGGTATGHVISVARSDTARGPFISAPHNPVYSHRSMSHPVQNVGHADLVERPDGTWAAVYLGVRKRGGTPQFHTNGRETFLASVDWIDDWPVFTKFPAPAASYIAPVVDRFDAPTLHPRWVSPGLRPTDLVRHVDGGLMLHSSSSASGESSGLFTRVQALAWRASFDISPHTSDCRMILRLDSRHWYGIRVGRTESGSLCAKALSHVGDVEAIVGAADLPSARVNLVIDASPDLAPNSKTRAPDIVRLAVHVDGSDVTLASLDGRYLSTEVAGGFTGRVVGLVVDEGETEVHEFRYTDTTRNPID